MEVMGFKRVDFGWLRLEFTMCLSYFCLTAEGEAKRVFMQHFDKNPQVKLEETVNRKWQWLLISCPN